MTEAVGTLSTAVRRGLASRTVGVLTSPRATYADVAADPRSLGVLAVVHFVRVRRALSDHRHDEMARSLHGWRERRGF